MVGVYSIGELGFLTVEHWPEDAPYIIGVGYAESYSNLDEDCLYFIYSE